MNKTFWAKIMLFAATVIWGYAFLVVKDTVNVFPPNFLIAGRFLLSFVILSAVFAKRYKKINKSYIVSGAVIGFALFAAYSAQTIGITDTTPGKNAFLTATYCVMVPFFAWAVTKKRPDIYSFVAAFVCITGIGLVALKGNFTMSLGDALTLLCGFLFAVHLLCVKYFGDDKDPFLVATLQFGFAGAFSMIAALLFEKAPTDVPQSAWLWLMFLAMFPTAMALTFQIVGQKYTKPESASLILSLEAVFGVVFSLLAGTDTMNLRLGAGFLLIFAALIISETKLSFLQKKE